MLSKTVSVALAVVSCLWVGGCKSTGGGTGGDASADRETALVSEYEVLSDRILADRGRELALMKDLIDIYRSQADEALATASTATGDERAAALKTAIQSITKISQEGDTRVDGIKLKLRKGGHHHNQEEGSEEEYIFIDSKAKKALMAEAEKLRAALASGGEVDLAAVQNAVDEIVFAALKAGS